MNGPATLALGLGTKPPHRSPALGQGAEMRTPYRRWWEYEYILSLLTGKESPITLFLESNRTELPLSKVGRNSDPT